MTFIVIGDKVRRNVLVSSDHGLLIVNRFDYDPGHKGTAENVGVGQFILDHGNTSTVDAGATAEVLRGVPDPIILDVGANIGTYATWVSRIASRVYCFEPQRLVFQMLCGNMAINNIDNVYAFNYAMSNFSGEDAGYVEIDAIDYEKINSFGDFSLRNRREKYFKPGPKDRVKMTTIDAFVLGERLPKVDFIKIDVEGMDIEVLEGALETIRSFRPSIYVEFLNVDKGTLAEILTNLKYKIREVDMNFLAVPLEKT